MTETLERTYTTMDRSHWASGPWDDEPDKVQWVDGGTDLDCLAVRNGVGAWCGYVGVPEGHPWYAVDYSSSTCGHAGCYEHTPDSMTSVHGGITYSNFCDEDSPEAEAICHVPFPGRPEKVWWFGFDTCHLGDTYPDRRAMFSTEIDVYRTLAYVKDQCAILARQLKGVADAPLP